DYYCSSFTTSSTWVF
nr:immunoglobulin light chain junction region [Macaca mulatta]MOW28046.1 immunoglobulin light chain junction region [Macaca mulatta]MOW29523.1 immunoglobulin light chain junction region [Macaca mulatta]MOW29562.1 immunoglobulin light chain junction region [Macaca mulatta]MOW30314.1 immunoglobulin light chain junction region [Macaca mulatta]